MKQKMLLHAVSLGLMFPCQPMRAQSWESALQRLATSQTDTAKENSLDALANLSKKTLTPLCSPNAGSQTKRTLIRALEKENELVFTPASYTPARAASRSRLSESEMEYYANLIGCVAGLRDLSALNALLGAISTGGGATNGIATLGEPAVGALTHYLDTAGADHVADGVSRYAAILTLGRMAERTALPLSSEPLPKLSATALSAIRARLLVELRDENSSAREAAIRSLAPFKDDEVKRAIESIAKSDPARVATRDRREAYRLKAIARQLLKSDSVSAKQ